jgi:hypothetical protein
VGDLLTGRHDVAPFIKDICGASGDPVVRGDGLGALADAARLSILDARAVIRPRVQPTDAAIPDPPI